MNEDDTNTDSTVDVLSALALVLIPVVTIIYWLSGQVGWLKSRSGLLSRESQ